MARLIALLLLLVCVPAHADPFSLIAMAIVAVGEYVGVQAFLIYAGAALVGGAVARNKQKRANESAKNAYNDSLTAKNQTFLSSEAPWQIIYGEPPPVGGAIVAHMVSGDRDQYQHVVIVLAATALEEIGEIYLDGEPVGQLDNDGFPLSGPFVDNVDTNYRQIDVTFDAGGVVALPGVQITGNCTMTTIDSFGQQTVTVLHFFYETNANITLVYGPPNLHTLITCNARNRVPRVRIYKHNNADGVADTRLIADCPGEWTSDHKLHGRSYLIMRFDLDFNRFQQGMPNVTAKCKGKKGIYDPRDGLLKYTRNPALCWADFVCNKYGFGAAYSQLDMPALIAAANACDVVAYPDLSGDAYSYLYNLGNSRALYTCDGVFNTGEGRDNTRTALERSMGGVSFESGGVWVLRAGTWSTPLFTLNPTDLRAPVEIVQSSYGPNERVNGARGRYLNAAGLGVPEDVTPYQNAVFLAADVKAKWADVQVGFTTGAVRAIQMLRMAVEMSRGGQIILVSPRMLHWKAQPGDRFILNEPAINVAAKVYRIQDWAHARGNPCAFTAIEDVPTIYDLTNETAQDPAPNVTPVNPRDVENLLFDGEPQSGTNYLTIQADGTIVTNVFIPIKPATRRNVFNGGNVEVVWRRTDSEGDGWVNAPEAPGNATSVMLSNVPEVPITIGARFSNDLNLKGHFNYITHQVIGKTAPPSDMTVLNIDGDTLSWPPITDADRAGYVFRFHYGQNTDWGTAAPLHTEQIVSSPYRMIQRPSGPVTILGKAIDTTEHVSLNAIPVFTDLGDAPVANVVEVFDFEAMGWPGVITGGSIVGTDIVANATDSFYGADAASFYDSDDTASLYETGTYTPLVYVTSQVLINSALAGSYLTVMLESLGANATVEYQKSGPEPFYGTGSAPFYGVGPDSFYGPPGDWLPLPGQLLVENVGYAFRITIGPGAVQGVIDKFSLTVDAPDIIEDISDLPLVAAGTVVPYTKPFTVIKYVYPALQANGSGATRLGIVKVGPLTTVLTPYNAANVGVNGATADVQLKGY